MGLGSCRNASSMGFNLMESSPSAASFASTAAAFAASAQITASSPSAYSRTSRTHAMTACACSIFARCASISCPNCCSGLPREGFRASARNIC
jgi:hypothetical protein